jgi:hypothetical protein
MRRTDRCGLFAAEIEVAACRSDADQGAGHDIDE